MIRFPKRLLCGVDAFILLTSFRFYGMLRNKYIDVKDRKKTKRGMKGMAQGMTAETLKEMTDRQQQAFRQAVLGSNVWLRAIYNVEADPDAPTAGKTLALACILQAVRWWAEDEGVDFEEALRLSRANTLDQMQAAIAEERD